MVERHYMPFEPRYHAKHIHFLAKIPQMFWSMVTGTYVILLTVRENW